MARLNDEGPYKVGNVRICLHGENNSEAWIPGPRLDSRIAKMKTAQLGRKRGPHSEETKRKIAASNRGQKRSLEFRLAVSLRQKGRKRK